MQLNDGSRFTKNVSCSSQNEILRGGGTEHVMRAFPVFQKFPCFQIEPYSRWFVPKRHSMCRPDRVVSTIVHEAAHRGHSTQRPCSCEVWRCETGAAKARAFRAASATGACAGCGRRVDGRPADAVLRRVA